MLPFSIICWPVLLIFLEFLRNAGHCYKNTDFYVVVLPHVVYIDLFLEVFDF